MPVVFEAAIDLAPGPWALTAVAHDKVADEIKAVVAQSQKRSAVYDIVANPTNVSVEVA